MYKNNPPYNEGRKAFFDLLDRDENPHILIDNISAFDWNKGWTDASKESDKWDYTLNEPKAID